MLGRTIARNTFWIGLDTLFGMVAAATISIIAARMLGPQVLGYYNYVIWVAGLTSILARLGVPAATNRFVAEYVGRGEVGRALGVVRMTLRFQVLSAAAISLCACAVILVAVDERHRAYAALVILSVGPNSLMAIFAAAINATEESFHNVWPSFLANVVNLVGTIAALWLGWSLIGLAAMLLVSRTADCLLRYFAFRRVYQTRFPGRTAEQLPADVRGRIRRFCAQGTVLWVLNAVVWDRSDMVFVQRYCSSQEVAFFSLSFNLLTQALVLPQVLISSTGLSMGVQYGREPALLGRVAAVALRYVLLFSIPLVFGLAAVSSSLVPVLYGDAFRPAVPVVAIAGFFGIARAALGPAQRLLIISENQSTLIWIGAATGVLNVALDVWWIPNGHALGAALANGIAQTLAAIAVWVAAIRYFKIEMPWASVLRLVVAGLLMALGVGALCVARPGSPTLLLSIAAGAILYILLLRSTGALDEGDFHRLAPLQDLIPTRLTNSYLRLLRLLTGGRGGQL